MPAALLTVPIMVVVGVGALVLIVMAFIKANDGVAYRYPFAIRVIKQAFVAGGGRLIACGHASSEKGSLGPLVGLCRPREPPLLSGTGLFPAGADDGSRHAKPDATRASVTQRQ
ncbi:MAG: DUF4870 domain-containing protein [Pseudomonadota bacterium]|nr:DUF4870 domain-containing protein [Pseudomonadota bacterium]